ncbi:MAG: large-conductance mechanosensitive channel protein MscL [Vampirovibrionales bacterium]|nr:large-conductance mechanosensitive channel protein MscL [Vampirovibrionales bacterium]
MRLLSEFKTFLSQGNAMDLAIGVIIGGAFGKTITSLVDNILMPPIGLLLGQMNFSELGVTLKPAVDLADGTHVSAVILRYGAFLQSVLDFIIIAFCVFMIIKSVNTVRKLKTTQEEAIATPPSEEVMLLTDIRDLLSTQKSA